MRKILLLLVTVSFLFTSCDLFKSHGKKVKFGDNEVYYKGDGVTEEDAKNLGEFLEKSGYFSEDKNTSVQLTKDDDTYVVRLVVNTDVYEKEKEEHAMTYWYYQDLISENVFDGQKTSIVIADDKMKDVETIDPVTKVKVGKNHYVYYKGKGIKKDDAKEIGEKLEKETFFDFTDGGKFLLTKVKGEYAIRFIGNKDLVKKDKADYYRVLTNLQYIFSKYTIGEEVKLIVMNDDLQDVQDFEEPSEAEKTRMDLVMRGETDPNDPGQYTNNQYNTADTTATDDIEGGGY